MKIKVAAPDDSYIVGPYRDGQYAIVPPGGWIPIDQLGFDVEPELIRNGHVYCEDVAVCTVGEFNEILKSLADKIEEVKE